MNYFSNSRARRRSGSTTLRPLNVKIDGEASQETDRKIGEARVNLLSPSSLMRDFLRNERQWAEVWCDFDGMEQLVGRFGRLTHNTYQNMNLTNYVNYPKK